MIVVFSTVLLKASSKILTKAGRVNHVSIIAIPAITKHFVEAALQGTTILATILVFQPVPLIQATSLLISQGSSIVYPVMMKLYARAVLIQVQMGARNVTLVCCRKAHVKQRAVIKIVISLRIMFV